MGPEWELWDFTWKLAHRLLRGVDQQVVEAFFDASFDWWRTRGVFESRPETARAYLANRMRWRALDVRRRLARRRAGELAEWGNGPRAVQEKPGEELHHDARGGDPRALDNPDPVELRQRQEAADRALAELSRREREVLLAWLEVETDYELGASICNERLGLSRPLTAAAFQTAASKAWAAFREGLGRYLEDWDEERERNEARKQGLRAARAFPELCRDHRAAVLLVAGLRLGRIPAENQETAARQLFGRLPAADEVQGLFETATAILVAWEAAGASPWSAFLDDAAVLEAVFERHGRGIRVLPAAEEEA